MLVSQDYVLIVDDQLSTVTAIEACLKGVCRVVSTTSPFNALRLIQQYAPALIILDVEMPQLNGFELFEKLLASQHDFSSKVIFITSHCDAVVEKRALSLGAIDFIHKPINHELCKLRITNHLQSIKRQSALSAAHDRLVQEKNRLTVTLESIADAVITTDEGLQISYMNASAQRLTGWQLQQAAGEHIDTVMCLSDISAGVTAPSPLKAALEQKRTALGDLNIQLNNRYGDAYQVEYSASPVLTGDGVIAGGVVVFRDVTDAVRMASQMTHITNHDPLTGLPNRVLFHERICQAMTNAGYTDSLVAVLIIDIDNFKTVNELLGHAVGDSIINHVARHIESAISSKYTLSHIGGDEFALLIDNVANISRVNVLAANILKTKESPFILNGEKHHLSLSIGISVFPTDAGCPEDLMRNADAAMYKVKAQGKNNFGYYSERLLNELKDRVEMEKLLRQSLHSDNLVLHYQPKVELKTGRITGAEALVRLQDKQGNLIFPDRFISIAEETSLIIKLGQQVLRKACTYAAECLQLQRPLKIAVNIDAQHFTQADFPNFVAGILKETGLPPAYLELEVTETALMNDVNAARCAIEKLSEIGVSIALDDFGTGYSSLSYLRTFDLDVLKIDRSFLKDATDNAQARHIIKAIVSLAEMLGLALVCEGIETERQLGLILDLGCCEGQGYLFSQPASKSNFDMLFCDGFAHLCQSCEAS